ncbi:unnamed protein product [Rotaria sordida]|uniref:Transmembrane protein n=1 Tax=Rotaria sordida TaxID=392033 RepID=A0A814LQT3_9BILA|nr:unnamed protein product [Rotaria sordida]CAF1069582.1 unnamed protein product [Rotaria sordida]
MIINRILNLIEFIVIMTVLTCIVSQQQQRQLSSSSSNQLFHIVTALKPFHSQLCQFKFENCIQDSSYADQLNNHCNIYSRLRDCFRLLLDESQCLSLELKHEYKKAKQNEYEACGVRSSYESIRSSFYISSSSKLNITYLTIFFLFIIFIS